jgi:hypothetical protein
MAAPNGLVESPRILLILLPFKLQELSQDNSNKNKIDSMPYNINGENPLLNIYLNYLKVSFIGILSVMTSDSRGKSSAAISNERRTP